MKRLFFASMLLAPITLMMSACATIPTAPPPPGMPPAVEQPAPVEAAVPADEPSAIERASAAFEVAEKAYARIRDWSFRIEKFLPDRWQDRLVTARAIADRALVAGRAAKTIAEQAKAMRELNAAAGGILAAAKR